jgi:NADH-quinone oxidoreductase subunit G
MPKITINGRDIEFTKGQTILQVALDNEIEIPHYCYHPGLSIVANCRICLAEVWGPNPKTGALEPMPKLLPTCQTTCGENQVVYTDSPKAIANQKSVMELLLINHPVDCPVCDQAGECHLQDYSYQYGRGVSRFQEEKIKQPKKDVGEHVLLYSDRCIMCTRCVRFTREVTGTGELYVDGRGATEQIDVFPGLPVNNELSANVIDICPVGALLDKDFLFQQRVWFLEKTPSIDGITASGDNISIEHNKGVIYRIKPRVNMDVNKWWITDEVRYGWKFVHSDERLSMPRVKGLDGFDRNDPVDAPIAWDAAYEAVVTGLSEAKKPALMVSPMLSCEDAYLLAKFVLDVNPGAVLAVGPVPIHGEDKTFPGSSGGVGFKMYAEKAPNARGVRRVLKALSGGKAIEFDALLNALSRDGIDAILMTGNYPSDWVTPQLMSAVESSRSLFVALIDTLPTKLADRADVLIPGATWAEKAGTFENANGRLQAFARAIAPLDFCKSESQIALDLSATRAGDAPVASDAAATRMAMADAGMREFIEQVHMPQAHVEVQSDMQLVEL